MCRSAPLRQKCIEGLGLNRGKKSQRTVDKFVRGVVLYIDSQYLRRKLIIFDGNQSCSGLFARWEFARFQGI
jgi:hypothetical protein